MSLYQFMRDDLQDTYGILKLQDKILEIMVYIDKFCKENEITYYLMGGSALGAMRHGGFIPWDDDLDIFMPYEDYMRFLRICDQKLDKSRFYLQKENTAENPYFFSKLRMNGTACLNPCIEFGHQGIFVDIMCLNAAASRTISKKVQYYAAGLLKASAITKTKYHTKSKLKKIQLFISKIVVHGFVKKWLLHLVRRYNGRPTSEVAHLFGRAKFANSFYKTEDFGKGRIVPFEKVQLVVPQKVEDYLTVRYGERYMEMPDEKTKAVYQTHAMQWSVDHDYSEFQAEQK